MSPVPAPSDDRIRYGRRGERRYQVHERAGSGPRAWAAWSALIVASCVVSCGAEPPPRNDDVRLFRGAADASAVEFVADDTIVVADDEDNVLRYFRYPGGGLPIATSDLSTFLQIDRHEEADIEASARIADRIYWITSHARDKDGDLRTARCALFATESSVGGKPGVLLRPVGSVFRELAPWVLQSLAASGVATAEIDRIDPAGRVVRREARLASPAAGLNVEGLAAAPDGATLFIGLRSPLHELGGVAHSIVVALRNPAAVVEVGAIPDLGRPLFWDLGGRGVRSMLWNPVEQAYLIVAASDGESAGLYRWNGDPATSPSRLEAPTGVPPDLTIEAAACIPRGGRVLLLSDDGARRVPVERARACKGEPRPDGTCRNKDLRDASRRSFRGVELRP